MSRHPKPATPLALDAPPDAVDGWKAPKERLAYRLDDLPAALSISRRTIERERSAGRFPKPDRVVGKMPLWSPETIRRWVEGGNNG